MCGSLDFFSFSTQKDSGRWREGRSRSDHAGGWSVDAQVTIPEWDRQGLERLVRYCARPPLSLERLGRLDDEHLVYRLRKPTVLPARSPPQGELSFDAGGQAAAGAEAWPEIDQTGGGGDGWG